MAEGRYSRGGNQTARFMDAAGSASETRSALQVAAAWGHVPSELVVRSISALDEILAIVVGPHPSSRSSGVMRQHLRCRWGRFTYGVMGVGQRMIARLLRHADSGATGALHARSG